MSKHKPKDAHGPAAHGPVAPGDASSPAAHGAHGDAHGSAHPAEAHAHHGPTKGGFITIFLVLGFLTVVEVFVPQVYNAPWNHSTKMLLLCTLAIGKAMLVALYFMHLKWEAPWLRRIALLPAYMGIIAVLLMIETAWRNSLS
jgi:cytochrome c oxidase subunit IV